jgi:hypothetical protein
MLNLYINKLFLTKLKTEGLFLGEDFGLLVMVVLTTTFVTISLALLLSALSGTRKRTPCFSILEISGK